MHTVLITGGNGKMGRCIAEGLREAGYNVRSTSRTPNPELGVEALNIRDREACLKIMEGVDTVIHMAYHIRSDQFLEEQVQTNMIGTWNVYEAAAKAGVKRIIFGSSNHAVGFYKRGDELREDIMQRPDSPYGLSKAFSELCGRYLSDRCGISVINVRIGTFPHDDVGLPNSIRNTRTWLSNRDCKQLFLRCVEADESIKFLTLYGISNNANRDFDISRLGELIGYYPEDDGSLHMEYARSANGSSGLVELEFLGNTHVKIDPFTGQSIKGKWGDVQEKHNEK